MIEIEADNFKFLHGLKGADRRDEAGNAAGGASSWRGATRQTRRDRPE